MSNSVKNNSRTEQKQQTRKSLIDATKKLIATEGISSITMAKVATSVGLSQGVVNFHFATKDALMLEVLHSHYDRYQDVWLNQNDYSKPIEKRLKDIITSLFDPAVTNEHDSAIWAGFWSQKATRKKYVDIFDEKDEQLLIALIEIFDELRTSKTKASSKSIATNVVAFVSGHEIDLLLTPNSYCREEAIQGCLDYLSFQFPNIKF